MITVTQKRLVMGLCATLLLMPSAPTKASNNNALGTVAASCAVAAGIFGLGYLVAQGIRYAWTKSDEQVSQEAEEALRNARSEGHHTGQRFYAEFMNTFMNAWNGNPSLAEIENNFLSRVAYLAYYSYNRFDMAIYIKTLSNYKTALKDSLDQVSGRIAELRNDRRTNEYMYNRLVDLERALQAELQWYEQYYPKFADHRAYFEIYDFESRQYETYAREFEVGRQYAHDRYAFGSLIMQEIHAKDLDRNYPLVTYYNRLNRHIETLKGLIKNLRYHYAARKPEAQQLLDYLLAIRDVLVNNTEFKKEAKRKRDDDERREYMEREARAREREARAREQEAAAREREAHAREMEACARMRRADAERERNRIERERLAQQQAMQTQVTVIIPAPTTTVTQTTETTTTTVTTNPVATPPATNEPTPVYVDYSYWGE